MTNEQRIAEARRQWYMKGETRPVAEIDRLVAAGEPVPERLLNFSGVKPEKSQNDPAAYDPPPRWGKGSGIDEWRDFARKTSDIDEDVLMALDRGDIQSMLEQRGVIPPSE